MSGAGKTPVVTTIQAGAGFARRKRSHARRAAERNWRDRYVLLLLLVLCGILYLRSRMLHIPHLAALLLPLSYEFLVHLIQVLGVGWRGLR